MSASKEFVVCFDVDNTLVFPSTKEECDLFVVDPQDGQEKYLKQHKLHIQLLKDHCKRGYYVIVWSAGGYDWAAQIVDALDLHEYVNDVMCKPIKIVDDLPVDVWMGKRIYLEDK